jgi:hypothetical protein
MHIEAELDDVHSERLLELQQRLQKPLSEVAVDISTKVKTTEFTLGLV